MRLVIYPDLSRKYGISYSRRQLQRLEDAGKFPLRLKLGDAPQSTVAWDQSEIEAWLDQAKRRRRAAS